MIINPLCELQQNIIPAIAANIRPNLYVELGVRGCETINKVAPFCTKAIAVDVIQFKHLIACPNIEEKIMTTDEYAKICIERIDMLFIDADHHYEQVKKDFWNFEKFVIPQGLIFLHDTMPEGVIELEQSSLDAYKFAEEIRRDKEFLDNFEIITIPTNPGLSIIRKTTTQLKTSIEDIYRIHMKDPYIREFLEKKRKNPEINL